MSPLTKIFKLSEEEVDERLEKDPEFASIVKRVAAALILGSRGELTKESETELYSLIGPEIFYELRDKAKLEMEEESKSSKSKSK